MKKALRVIVILLVMVMLMGLMISCGSKKEAPAAVDTTKAETTVSANQESTAKELPQELSFWGWQGELEEAWLNNLIPDFKANNPGVKIEMVMTP